jgi:dipeptidyl aminopeptidase/acylaminoacyl peptidase
VRWFALLVAATALAAACSGPSGSAARPTSSASSAPAGHPSPTPAPAESTPPPPTPPLPAYYIESLRARPYPGGKLEIGAEITCRGFSRCLPGVHTYRMSWPSGGQTMTGMISMPQGSGPFPVVVVNHGFIPPERYGEGQDSLLFAEPMAAQGFIALSPNWPGYLGSGPAPPDLPSIVGQVVTALDLVSSVGTLPQADLSRVAFVGHSNGGGISEIAMVVDPRIKAVVLHAPVSSDMADNARQWWLSRPDSLGSLGAPDANPQGYQHLSPRNYLAAGQAPVLIVQGTADHTIPRPWTEATYAALQAKGVKSELDWIDGGDHDLVDDNQARAISLQVDWIRKTLGV